MKLKTLKDLVEVFPELGRAVTEEIKPIAPEVKVQFQRKYVMIEDLRQEAIKWIKQLNQEIKDMIIKDTPVSKYQLSEIWIKHFFNISEEDLK